MLRIFSPLSSLICCSRISDHTGGSFAPQISTIFDVAIAPGATPSFGTISAYHSSAQTVVLAGMVN